MVRLRYRTNRVSIDPRARIIGFISVQGLAPRTVFPTFFHADSPRMSGERHHAVTPTPFLASDGRWLPYDLCSD